MKAIDIINKFYNGELKPRQEFSFDYSQIEDCRIKKERIRVNEFGTYLCCEWLDSRGYIIRKCWGISLSDLQYDKYEEN